MAERLTPTTQCTRTLAEEDILVKDPFPAAGPPRGWGADPSSFLCPALGVLCDRPWTTHSALVGLSFLIGQISRPTCILPTFRMRSTVLNMRYKTLCELAPADPAASSQAVAPLPSVLGTWGDIQFLEAVMVSGLSTCSSNSL